MAGPLIATRLIGQAACWVLTGGEGCPTMSILASIAPSAERRRGCFGSHLHWPDPLLVAPAEFRLSGVPGGSGTSTPAAHTDPAAGKAREILNMRIRVGHDGDELGI